MFSSPAFRADELGDHDVTVVDGRIHLHYLCLPNHDVVGHAVSDDGLTFVPANPPIRTGNPGQCDDDMIWTMHTVQAPATGRYHMYYTACSLAENGGVQRVAMATSEDFEQWTKHPDNPILQAAPPHYNADFNVLGRISFRDPFVFITDDGQWHMLVTAGTAQGDRLRRGCVAHAVSNDGLAWTLQAPLYAPAHMDDLEVPALIQHNGRYYLFLLEFRTSRTFYRVSESLDGPWKAPATDEILPPSNCVTRFCEWEGKLLVYTWYRCQADWPRRSAEYRAVVPPKEVHFEDDGTVRLSTFSGWSKYLQGKAQTIAPDALTAYTQGPGRWSARDANVSGAVDGLLVGAAEGVYDDFVLDATLRCDRGHALGIIFRASDDMEEGNWIRLDIERGRIELHRMLPMDSGLNRTVRMQPSLRQSYDIALPRGRDIALHLVAAREYIEVSLNGRVCLSTATYARTGGRVGMFIENAEGAFGPIAVQHMDPPTTAG